MKKYVIFDFDGTLANSKEVATKVLHQLADDYQFPKIDLEQIASLQGYAESVEQFERIAEQFYKRYKESLHEIHLFDGIKEMLQQLHDSGKLLAVISSNEESNIRAYFQKQEIAFISEVYTSSNLLGKDIMIDRFCEKHQIDKREVIYVGDELRDLRACKKSGVDMIWVRWGFGSEAQVQHEGPTYYAETPNDIIDFTKLPNQ
ncbi:MAG: HAD-IA family hydrolase [Bacillus sp. (in: firmicutes)]